MSRKKAECQEQCTDSQKNHKGDLITRGSKRGAEGITLTEARVSKSLK